MSKKLKFNGPHLSKNYIASSKTLFTDLSNVTFNWLVVWKMTWGIKQIFARVLKVSKLGFWWDPLIQSWKTMSLKSTASYLSWQWRMTQNLKRNWLAISKLTWGIWQIVTRALESLKYFHFNVLLLSKVYIFWAKKVQMSYL